MKNIFSVITLKTLRQNRTRTIVTIIGVILSTAMITAVTTFVWSFWGFLHDYEIERSGNWHVTVMNVPSSEAENLMQEEQADAAARIDQIGYARWEKAMNRGNKWGYLFLEGLTEEAWEMLPVSLSVGRIPENSGEILIPWYLAANEPEGEETKPGDVLELEPGGLYIEGERITPSSAVSEELAGTESLENTQKRKYTVVGVYNHELLSLYENGVSAFPVYCGPSEEPSAYCDVVLRLKNPMEAFDFAKEKSGAGYSFAYNHGLLRWEGAFDNDNIQTVLFGLVAIVTGLIMAGAISLIYNAFSISLRERTTQFGLLSSLGATKKQLRQSLLYEALFVSIVGIPAGVFSGIAGIGITLHYISTGITGMVHGVERQIALRTSLPVLLGTVLLALLTVVIAAWVPSARIRRISPMEAIRASRDIKISPRQVASGRGLSGLFGLPGMLADKNYKRDRKKYRSTIFSLTMSIVLFVSAVALGDFLRGSGSFVLEAPEVELQYVAYTRPEDRTREEIQSYLAEQPGVQKVIFYRSGGREVAFSQETLAEQPEYLQNIMLTVESGKRAIYANVIVLPDELFDQSLRTQGLQPSEYHGQELLTAAIYDTRKNFNANTERYERIQLFSGFPVSCEVGYLESEEPKENTSGGESRLSFKRQLSLNIQGRLEELPEGVVNNYENSPHIVVPESEAQKWGLCADDYGAFAERYSVLCSSYRELYEKLEKEWKEQGLLGKGGQTLLNLASQYEQDRNFLMAVNILTYGFVILLSLVAAANAFNTISTNLLLRRREFAMLRSMGMSGRAMRKMLCFESMIYSLHSILPGVILAAGVSYLIHLVGRAGVDNTFRIPWKPSGIAAAGVVLIVLGTMKVTMRKIRKANICEELKINE